MNRVTEVTQNVLSNPKSGLGGAAAGILSWLGDFWSMLGDNVGTVVGLVSVLVGLVSIYNQTLQIRLRRRELKGSDNANS